MKYRIGAKQQMAVWDYVRLDPQSWGGRTIWFWFVSKKVGD